MDVSAQSEERSIWNGSPSQWLNFRAFLLSAIAAGIIVAALVVVSSRKELGANQTPVMIVLGVLLLLPIFIAVKRYLDIRCRQYEVSDQRVRLTRGILSKRTDGLELYRVDDTLLFQPLLLRIVGKGNIRLVTTDRTNPSLLIEAVPQSRWLWEELRHAVEACRDRKRTRVIDFEDNDMVPQS